MVSVLPTGSKFTRSTCTVVPKPESREKGINEISQNSGPRPGKYVLTCLRRGACYFYRVAGRSRRLHTLCVGTAGHVRDAEVSLPFALTRPSTVGKRAAGHRPGAVAQLSIAASQYQAMERDVICTSPILGMVGELFAYWTSARC